MAMMVRRRRRQPGDDGEGEEADPEGLPLHDQQLEEEQLALEDGEDVGEEETLEGPKGPPTTLTPMTPLFTPEQLKGMKCRAKLLTGDWRQAEPGEKVLYVRDHTTPGSRLSEEREGRRTSIWPETKASEAAGQNQWWWKWNLPE